jgi:hypothetical protein
VSVTPQERNQTHRSRLQNVSTTLVDSSGLAKTREEAIEGRITLNQNQLEPEVARHQ